MAEKTEKLIGNFNNPFVGHDFLYTELVELVSRLHRIDNVEVTSEISSQETSELEIDKIPEFISSSFNQLQFIINPFYCPLARISNNFLNPMF